MIPLNLGPFQIANESSLRGLAGINAVVPPTQAIRSYL